MDNPHHDLQKEIERQQVMLRVKMAHQEKRRASAIVLVRRGQEQLDKLNAVTNPISNKIEELNTELHNRMRVTLAPWVIDGGRKWKSGTRHTASGKMNGTMFGYGFGSWVVEMRYAGPPT